MGIPPDWYKGRNYLSRAVREPRAVLAEFGTELPEGVAVQVHDSTRYLILPMKPPGIEGISKVELAALLTRLYDRRGRASRSVAMSQGRLTRTL